MQGMTLSVQGHQALILPPQDAAGGVNCDRFSMAKWRHASITIMIGNSAQAGVPTITVKEYAAASGGSGTAIAFDYYKEETAGGDTLSTRQAATSSGFTVSANNNIFYTIELDARELSDGYPWVEVVITQDSADSIDMTVLAMLTGGRYEHEANETVLS